MVNMLKRHWLIAGLVVVAIAVFAAFQFKGNDQPKYFTTKVDRGEIRQVVEATGTINAVTTVQVGSQVSGTISRLNADFNSRVKKGQVVAQIDPSLFRVRCCRPRLIWRTPRPMWLRPRPIWKRRKLRRCRRGQTMSGPPGWPRQA